MDGSQRLSLQSKISGGSIAEMTRVQPSSLGDSGAGRSLASSSTMPSNMIWRGAAEDGAGWGSSTAAGSSRNSTSESSTTGWTGSGFFLPFAVLHAHVLHCRQLWRGAWRGRRGSVDLLLRRAGVLFRAERGSSSSGWLAFNKLGSILKSAQVFLVLSFIRRQWDSFFFGEGQEDPGRGLSSVRSVGQGWSRYITHPSRSAVKLPSFNNLRGSSVDAGHDHEQSMVDGGWMGSGVSKWDTNWGTVEGVAHQVNDCRHVSRRV